MSTRGNTRGGRGSGGTERGGGRGDHRGGGGFRGGDPGRGGGGNGRGGDRGGFDNRGRGAPRGGGRGGGIVGPVIFSEDRLPTIPPHLSDASQNQLIKSFESLPVRPRPLRPGFGTLGTPGILRANFFAVKLPKGPVYDYVVDITPKIQGSRDKARLFELLEINPAFSSHVPYIAHDRAQRIVSAKKLPQPFAIDIKFYYADEAAPKPNAKTYSLVIKFDRELDTNKMNQYLEGKRESRDYDTLPLVSALNLILQQYASRKGVRVGQNKFFIPSSNQRLSLGPGVEAWQGFFISVRPSFKQLLVNVNVCMTAFVEPGNLADALRAFERNTPGAMPTLPKQLVKSIKVKTTHLGHTKKLFAIGTTPPRNSFFNCQEFGGKISVEEFFRKKYKITLKFPTDLPVVNLGTKEKPVMVPPELCTIEPGQVYKGRLNDRETAQMIRHACNPPRVNAETIVNTGFSSMGLNPLASPADQFGIQVSTDMVGIPFRELPPPRLAYKVGNARPNNGSWNILDVKFQRGATVMSWWVLVVRDAVGTFSGPDDQRLRGLVDGFSAKCRNSGINFPQALPRLIAINLSNATSDPGRIQAINNIRQTIETNLARGGKPTFILVLLENRDNFIYPAIKRLGDMELGIHTMHMQLSKALGVPQKQDQYFSNVALKLNTKLGGMNHLLDPQSLRWLLKKKTMMVGIDVTHRSPGSKDGTPSIAAVVASVDDSFVQFPASLRIQSSVRGEKPKEMVDHLKEMMVERLELFKNKNKMLPERIFVFRDGVSEGQFDTVLEEELGQIIASCASFKGNDGKVYRPKLSIVVCGKRHHARMFPTTSAQADRNGNTRPGTVVDKGITAIFDFDFYLQAHAGLQGHVKGTHYTVVYDENALSADEIQQGTHHASYLYARATKAVSLIPAAYYADLVCERARYYLNDFFVDDATSTAGSSRGKRDKAEEQERVYRAAEAAWGNGLHLSMRESMFYI